MFEIVKSVIDEWNPYDLLPSAPSDEYDSESYEIAKRIEKNSSISKIADIVLVVFSKSFDEKLDIQKCIKPAQKIHELLKGNNIK